MSVESDVFAIITWYKIQEFNFLPIILQKVKKELWISLMIKLFYMPLYVYHIKCLPCQNSSA